MRVLPPHPWLGAAASLLLCLLPLTGHAAEAARDSHTAEAPHDMAVAADPLTAAAGREILRAGGSAIDAAIAMAVTLTVAEPESAGIGGGAFLLDWSARDRRVTSFDGRETAPAAARPDRFLGPDGTPLAFYTAVVGGRSVGVPGLLRMLALAHARFGRLPWARLMAPAIHLAADGFPISPRLHALLASDRYLANDPAARAFFYRPDGSAKPAGTILVNPPLAATLREIAQGGAEAFYRGAIAADVVATVDHANPAGDLTLADLAAYKAKERPPVCGTYRGNRVCGMGPPSAGGPTLVEILDLLQPFDLAAHRDDATAWSLFAQASRLAYADRARWLGDTDFEPAPVAGLIDPAYVAARARLIDPDHTVAGPVAPGDPPGADGTERGDNAAPELPSTSSLAVVDRDGNMVAVTASIENSFGSRLMVRGFLLNNELTDFSFLPVRDGKPVANRVEGGKRPLSAMAPTLVFDAQGAPEMALGSAGGPAIITDVAKTLVGVLDWHLGLEAAMALPNVTNRNGPTEVEAGPAAAGLAAALEARGMNVRIHPRASGLAGIRVAPAGLVGAADPRREGAALGD